MEVLSKKIKTILQDNLHRPWPMPSGPWQFYQEWLDLLFLHFQVDYELLRSLVPEELSIDRYQGRSYVSLVAFEMKNIRPRNIPALSPISDFLEINVRTYISQNGKKGVYFINIEASKYLSALVAKKLSDLPYEKSTIVRDARGYKNYNSEKEFTLNSIFHISEAITFKSELDIWLTERYCLYLDKSDGIYCFEIHHAEWDLFAVQMEECQLDYKIGRLNLNHENIESIHYATGVQVLAWKAYQLSLDRRGSDDRSHQK